MKKALICCRKDGLVVARALEKVIGLIEFEAVICTHEDALSVFLSEDFSHVIVLDYSERTEKNAGGFASYRDIKASASGQTIIRCGLDNYDYADYWWLPGELPRLFGLLSK